MGPLLGLLGLSWAVRGGRTRRAEGPEEARRASLELSGAMVRVSGLSRVSFEAAGAYLRLFFSGLWCPFAVLRLHSLINCTRQIMLTRASVHADLHAMLS